MYARLTTITLRSDKLQEGIDLYANSVVPAARAQAGNQGVWLLVDWSTGKGIAVTMWDSEADMLASEGSGYYQEQVAKLAPVMAAPPMRDTYEVAVKG